MARKQIKRMREAQKSLQLKLVIGDYQYEFEADMFNLNQHNLPTLSEQITKIPGNIAFIVEAHAEVNKNLHRLETEFEMWQAVTSNKYFADERYEKTKISMTMTRFHKEWVEYTSKIRAAKKLLGVLKAYEKGMDAKYQLAQTLCANLRAERESWEREPGGGGSYRDKMGRA